jgi:hypothetical protein
MVSRWALPVLVGVPLFWCTAHAHAQYQYPSNRNQTFGRSPNTRPAFSPYLNLLRRGTPPAINYYGIVRPELELRSDIGQLQTQVGTLQNEVQGGVVDPSGAVIPYTGHPTQFMNYGPYFAGVNAASGRRATGQPTTGGAPVSIGVATGGASRGGAVAPRSPRR